MFTLAPLQAEKYKALVDEVHHHRLQLMLAELYRNQTSIDALSSTRMEKQLEAVAKKDELAHEEEMVKAGKKQHRRLSVEQQLLEKEIRCVSELHRLKFKLAFFFFFFTINNDGS